MMKYPCLVLDHDDTVVQSEATVNYPYFCYVLDQFRPGTKITLEEYTDGCYHPGFVEMCKERYGFTDKELAEEYAGWRKYVQEHIPSPYPGIKELIQRYRAAGGVLCVVSHSCEENILRDYRTHFGIAPDAIYGWDLPPEQRKPSPYPLLDIMQRWGFEPHDLLVVDDMKPAWEMCDKAGVDMAFAAWGRSNCLQICDEMKSLSKFHFDTVAELSKFMFD